MRMVILHLEISESRMEESSDVIYFALEYYELEPPGTPGYIMYGYDLLEDAQTFHPYAPILKVNKGQIDPQDN